MAPRTPPTDAHAPYGPLPEGGTVRPITRWGTEVMHRPNLPVTSFDEELRSLAADMVAQAKTHERLAILDRLGPEDTQRFHQLLRKLMADPAG